MTLRLTLAAACLLASIAFAQDAGSPPASDARCPATDDDLRYWLDNMVAHHRFTEAEAAAATGLTEAEVAAACARFGIERGKVPARKAGEALRVLPYPGGRHPRIGFLDGAVRPQRETKFSAFAPWDAASYAVADVPEAIWSNLGLTYLAHTHVDTLWTKQGIALPKREWQRGENGRLSLRRELPNGIAFESDVIPEATGVKMELRLTNGTGERLTDLRVQNCVMLKGMPGFTALTNDNKVIESPFVACRSEDGKRWVLTAWQPIHRPWGNADVPCLHSDPRFPDCPPGKTVRCRGWLSFYEGDAIKAEMERLGEALAPWLGAGEPETP